MHMIPREDWQLADSTPRHAMDLPARGIHVHHSVTPTTNDPVQDMRYVERICMERFDIFCYSYGIHNATGAVLEGAGTQQGAHTKGYNHESFGIVFLGNFNLDRPTDKAIKAFQRLRHELVGDGFLHFDHYVLPHSDRDATACPGTNIMNVWQSLLKPYDGGPSGDDFDMTSKDEFKQAVREVLDEGTGYGQTSWAATSRRMMDRINELIREKDNLINLSKNNLHRLHRVKHEDDNERFYLTDFVSVWEMVPEDGELDSIVQYTQASAGQPTGILILNDEQISALATFING